MATFPSPTLQNLTVNGTATLTDVSSAAATITGGTIDGTPIGATTPAIVHATTINSTGAATLASVSTASATLTGGTVDGVTIGGTTPAAIHATTLNASGAVSGTGFTNLLAPYPTSATLAASGGSSLVGFLQQGTGAVARTEQDKGWDVISIKDFGAIGDGAHPIQDTAALLAVIAYFSTASDSRGCTIHFPRGHYNFTSTAQFNAFSSVTNFYLVGDGMTNTTLDFGGAAANTNGIYFNGGSQVSVEKLSVIGASGTGKGIVLNDQTSSYVSMATLRQVRVQNCGGDGIYSLQSYLVTLDEVVSTTNGGVGFNFAGNHTSIVSNKSYASNNTGNGWTINGAIYIDINAYSDGNARGFSLSNIRGGLLRSPGTESNKVEGILLQSSNALATGITAEYQDIHGLVIIGAHQIRNNASGPLGANANIAAISADNRPIQFTVIGCVDDVTAGDPSVALSGTSGAITMTQIDCQFSGTVATSGSAVIRNVTQAGNYCLLQMTVNQSIPNATATDVVWAGIVTGENTLNATATSTQIVIPTGVSRVNVSCGLKWTANGTGDRYIGIKKNGAFVRGLAQIRQVGDGSGTQYMTASSTYPLAVASGDTISVSVIQTSGAALDLDASGVDSWLCVTAMS